MKKFNLSVEDVNNIIEDRNKGMYVNDLTEKYNTTNGTVVTIYKAFNGNKKYYDLLGVESKKVVDECIRLNRKSIVNLQSYEVKILFGLIKLRITPVAM